MGVTTARDFGHADGVRIGSKEFEDGGHGTQISTRAVLEPKSRRQPPHVTIFRKNVRLDAFQVFVLGDADEAPEQLGSDAGVLISIGN